MNSQPHDTNNSKCVDFNRIIIKEQVKTTNNSTIILCKKAKKNKINCTHQCLHRMPCFNCLSENF